MAHYNYVVYHGDMVHSREPIILDDTTDSDEPSDQILAPNVSGAISNIVILSSSEEDNAEMKGIQTHTRTHTYTHN